MFETLFIDLPLAVLGYAAVVFILLKVQGDSIHDVTQSDGLHPRSKPLDLGVPKTKDAEVFSGRNDKEIDDSELPPHIPRDSQQQRHFVTHLFTLATDVHPRPEELKLRQHHRELILELVEEMLASPDAIEAMERLRLDRLKSVSPTIPNPQPDHARSAEGSNATLQWLGEDVLPIPEDAMLQRHYKQWLIAALEAAYPRPSDAMLKRHYDQWVESELDRLR